MIRSIRHKGPRLLYDKDDRRRLPAAYADKVARVLARLDVATGPADMDLPGLRLHPLKGTLAGFWSVSVTGNWRIVFRMEDGDAYDVDLLDYH